MGLLECSDCQLVADDSDDEAQGDADGEERAKEDDDPTYLNDWTEIFDDKPLRHEAWPEAATGMRLPFTDKAYDGGMEGRPKLPLGRWCFGIDDECAACEAYNVSVKRLPNLEPVDWVRLADISRRISDTPTP